MSTETVQTIIGRAMKEEEFRDLLFSDPSKALAGYELTDDEREALNEIKPETFEADSLELEERISRASLGGHGRRIRKLKIK